VGAIFAGVNALAFFLFFPESQFVRDTSKTTTTSIGTPQEKSIAADIPSEEIQSDEPFENKKKTFLQELKPYSKIDPNKNYLRLLFKPLPLVVYPATIFGFLVFAVSSWQLLASIHQFSKPLRIT